MQYIFIKIVTDILYYLMYVWINLSKKTPEFFLKFLEEQVDFYIIRKQILSFFT